MPLFGERLIEALPFAVVQADYAVHFCGDYDFFLFQSVDERLEFGSGEAFF